MSGIRVVRGPDWKWGSQDGGEGHVGTIVFPKDTDELSPKTTFVNWDKGVHANYRTGLGQKYDLLVYDSAPLGITHGTVKCDGCRCAPVRGMRWKCSECHDYDLCHECYMSDKHDKTHIFCRYDAPHLDCVPVSKRAGAVRCQAWGIFQDAKVVRGPDWQYSDQDGGKGTVGTVTSVMGWSDSNPRSAVKITWPNGSSNNYRMGYKGKVDVEYETESSGGFFYRDHLPKFDVKYYRVVFPLDAPVKVRDLPVETMRRLQQDCGGWQGEMTSSIGKDGKVVAVDKDGEVKVRTEAGAWFYNPLCLEAGAEEGDVGGDAGGLVQALLGRALAERLTRDLLGGLEAGVGDMSHALMVKAAAQGDAVNLQHLINAHPDLIDKKTKDMSALHVASHQGHLNCMRVLIKANATMNLRDNEKGLTPLHFSVLGNQPNATELLLSNGSTVDTADKNGLTALHICALHGKTECARTLLKEKFFCDRNAQDKDGDTPLHFAIVKDEKDMINILIHDKETDFKLPNNRGFNSLQWAALKDNPHAVRRILTKCPRMVDYKMDNGGHSALHIAAINGHSNVAKILIQGKAGLDMQNNDKKTPLHLAVEKGMMDVIELLVKNGAKVNTQDKDGDTALHVLQVKLSGRQLMAAGLLGMILDAADRDSAISKEKATKIGQYLIQNGADIYIKNKKDMTILDCIIDRDIRNAVVSAHENYRRKRPTRVCLVM